MKATLTVLGSGTSMGVPTVGCDCSVCTSADPRDRRLRPSIMVQYDGRTVLVDTSPDFREQAIREKIRRIDAVLYTHGHADHILGQRGGSARARQAGLVAAHAPRLAAGQHYPC